MQPDMLSSTCRETVGPTLRELRKQLIGQLAIG
jgi:hypothetical protein